MSVSNVPAVHIINQSLHVLRVFNEDKSIALREPVAVSSHADFLNSTRCMWLDQILEFTQSRIIRHVHQINSSLKHRSIVSLRIKTTLFEKRSDLANKVVDRTIVELTDALLSRLFA